MVKLWYSYLIKPAFCSLMNAAIHGSVESKRSDFANPSLRVCLAVGTYSVAS